FGRTFAVMMVHAQRPKEGHLSRWSPRVRGLIRQVDRVALYSADTLEILLPELDEKQALEVGRTIAARHDGEPLLVCGVAAFPFAATSFEEIIEVSRDAVRRATAEHPVRAAASEVQRTLSESEGAGAKLDSERFIMESAAMRAVAKTVAKLSQS